MTICVDASLVMKWLVPEDGSEEALRLYRSWIKKDASLVAPSLLDYEIGTALRQKVVRGLLRSDDLFPILEYYKRLNILLLHLIDLVSQAVSAAAALEQPTIYDVAYLLTAKQQKADYVTADEKFSRQAKPVFPFVKYFREL